MQQGPSLSAAEPSYPGVSVIMPVLNEERHLAAAVRGIVEQDYPGPVEIIIALGPSTDGTRAVADALVAGQSQDEATIRLVDNPTGRTPAALNRAVAAASYDYVVRVDGHGELTDGYLSIAVELLQRTGAANVGGIMDAQGRTPFEQAVAAAYTSRLGLGGSTFHLETSLEGPADTVFLGSFRKDALLAVGGFDESLHRAQDWELNYRLRIAGETVWFTPRMRVIYRPRSTVRALAKQFYDTGKWRREVVRRHPDTANPRYLAPPTAVVLISAGTLAGLGGAVGGRPARPGAVVPRLLRLGFAAPVGYLALVLAGSAALRRPLPPAARAWLPVVLVVMHMAWGAGFLAGVSRPAQPS